MFHSEFLKSKEEYCFLSFLCSGFKVSQSVTVSQPSIRALASLGASHESALYSDSANSDQHWCGGNVEDLRDNEQWNFLSDFHTV